MTESQVSVVLGISVRQVRNMGQDRRIRTVNTPGSTRGLKYCGEDVQRLIDKRDAPMTPAYSDGEGVNLTGRVPDWVNDKLIDRVDAAWFLLHSLGYIERNESEKVKMRIFADVVQCGAEGKFRCATAIGVRRDPVAPTPLMDEQSAADEERRCSIPPWEG